MSSKKTVTDDQHATSTQTLSPQYSSLVYGNVDRALGIANAPYQPYAGEKVAGFTPDQKLAQGILGDIASSRLGDDVLQQGITAARAAGAFAPQMVTAPRAQASGYAAARVAATPGATASLIDLSALPQVRAGSLLDANLTSYANPFTQSVIDAMAADAEHQRLVERNANAADATRAGAWRGNALAVTNALTDSNTNRALAAQSAQLRSDAYDRAAAAATADLDRRLAADQGNQAGAASALGANAAAGTQVNLANVAQQHEAAMADAAAANQAAEFGATATNAASLADQDATLRAGISNQAASQNAADTQLKAGQALGDLSTAQIEQAARRAALVGASGDAQQQQAQQLLDWQYQNGYLNLQDYVERMQQLVNEAVGLVPSTGSTTVDSHGVQVSKESPGLAGILASLATIGKAAASSGIGI